MNKSNALRPGVRAAYLVRRRLGVQPADGLGAIPVPVDDWFDGMIGFNQLQAGGGRLKLSYDASRLSIDQLLQVLEQHGCRPAATAFNRFRLGWYRYLDHNIAANARDQSSSSCSQSPLRHR